MKLEGSLDAFSLPDIFQLLSFTKKSGGLHLQQAALRGCVHFRDGTVTGATSDDGRQGLARRLIGSSAVSDDELAKAVDRAAGGEVGVGRALYEAGAIDEERLRTLVREQAVDAVFDLLCWEDGQFSFGVDEPDPDDIGVQFGVEEIVEQARGRREIWEHAREVIPSLDTVLVVPVAVDGEARLSRAEWGLLALVDGRRSVHDLAGLAGQGDFAVVSTLAGLVERGLLVVRPAGGEADEGAQALSRRHAILARLESRPAAASPTADPADTGDTTGEAMSIPHPASPAPEDSEPGEPEPAAAGVVDAEVHLVADTRGPVIPPRPEPFIPQRRPDFPEDGPRPVMVVAGGAGAAVAASREPSPDGSAEHAHMHVERDPSVNKSLLLRLIAGVRGL